MPDLATLNPAERETLALLAQGHTAKSIASLTGRSVASVNERLNARGTRPAWAAAANWPGCWPRRKSGPKKIRTSNSGWLRCRRLRQFRLRKLQRAVRAAP